MSLKEPNILRFDYTNVRRALQVSCPKPRTKGGRKTALIRGTPNARWIFNPVRLSNCPCNKRYF